MNQLEEIVSSDESYLVQIERSEDKKYKTIYLQNYRTKNGRPFLVNFMTFNCLFKIFRDYDEIFFFNDYAREKYFSS